MGYKTHFQGKPTSSKNCILAAVCRMESLWPTNDWQWLIARKCKSSSLNVPACHQKENLMFLFTHVDSLIWRRFRERGYGGASWTNLFYMKIERNFLWPRAGFVCLFVRLIKSSEYCKYFFFVSFAVKTEQNKNPVVKQIIRVSIIL